MSLISSNTLKLRHHSVSFTVSNEGPPISMSSISSAIFPPTDEDFLVLDRYTYFRLTTGVLTIDSGAILLRETPEECTVKQIQRWLLSCLCYL